MFLTWVLIFAPGFAHADNIPKFFVSNWDEILFANGAKDSKEMTKNLKDFVALNHPGSNEERADFFFQGIKRISKSEAGYGYSTMKIIGPDFVALIGRLGHGVVFIDGKLYATKFPPFNEKAIPELRDYRPFETIEIKAKYNSLEATKQRELAEWKPTKGPPEWSGLLRPVRKEELVVTHSGTIGWCRVQRQGVASAPH